MKFFCVLGRGGRGRSGYSNVRGRGSRGRGGDHYDSGAPRFTDSRDRYFNEGKKQSHKMSQNYSMFPATENWEDAEPVDTRRRTQDGDSEVSADETSATHSESSGERASEPKETVPVVNGTPETTTEDTNR